MFVNSNNNYIFVKQKRGRNRVKGAKSKMTQEQALEVIQQLGGKKFLAMTGTKNFLRGEISETNPSPWVRMDLTPNKSGANRLKITLEINDTYTMHFYRQTISKKTWDVTITKEQRFEMVYNDMLQPIFTEVTCLYTSL